MTKQTRVEPRKLKGFRDYPPAECYGREQILATIRRHARLAGYQEIATPALEYADVLLGNGGEEADKEVYRFMDHGDRLVALRYDLTVPFARFVAEHQGTLPLPFKKFQTGEVWRGEKPQKGRYRQFCQADFDIVGADTALADAEVIGVLASALQELVPVPFTMALSHRIVLSALIRKLLPGLDAAREPQVLAALDKLGKIGPEKVVALLCEQPGVATEAAQALLALLQPSGPEGTPLDPIAEVLRGDAAGEQGLIRLRQVQAMVRLLAPSDRMRVQVDLSIARGLGYYTGIVFETFIDGLPGFGSISSGGRYNELVSRFSSQELAGVGGSIGVDRLLAGLEELGALPHALPAQLLIAVMGDEVAEFALQVLATVRAAGIAADIAVKSGKLAQQLKHADRLQIPWVAVIGSDEQAQSAVMLKHMATGKQNLVRVAEIVPALTIPS